MRPPQRNLGPGNDWGRWVEEQLQGLSTSATQAEQGNQRSFANNNAALKQLTNQLNTLDEQNDSFVTTQVLPYMGLGSMVTIDAPEWANFAVIISAASCLDTTATGSGNIRLLHDNKPIKEFSEYSATSLYSYGPTIADFVGQRYPYVVSLSTNKQLYTCPFSVPLKATSGSITVTFAVAVTWMS